MRSAIRSWSAGQFTVVIVAFAALFVWLLVARASEQRAAAAHKRTWDALERRGARIDWAAVRNPQEGAELMGAHTRRIYAARQGMLDANARAKRRRLSAEVVTAAGFLIAWTWVRRPRPLERPAG